VLTNHALTPAAALSGAHHVALGGAGLGSLIIHLFIWHEIFRLSASLWRIPTFGPFIVVLLGLLGVGYLVWRQSGRRVRLGGSRLGRIRLGGIRLGRRRGGSAGYGSSTGPRDW
jgi:hypothetical protein